MDAGPPMRPVGRITRPFTMEVDGYESWRTTEPPDARHPARCPDHVMAKLREAALRLGLKINVGARRSKARLLGSPQDGTWERYIEVHDETLPERLATQTTVLGRGEEWDDAARRLGLWPTG